MSQYTMPTRPAPPTTLPNGTGMRLASVQPKELTFAGESEAHSIDRKPPHRHVSISRSSRDRPRSR